MSTSFYPGNLQWMALGKETTYGTPAAAPTVWFGVATPKWTPTPTILVDQGIRGFMGNDYQQQQGTRYDVLTYQTMLYTDSAYQHLLAMLGNPDTVSGSAAPYTHKTSLYNGSGSNGAQPSSYTAWLFHPSGLCIQIPGMQMVECKISIKADALPTLDATWHGMPAATNVTAPVNTPSTQPPMPPTTAVVSVGGSPLSKYSELDIDIKRGTKAIPALTGTQSPVAIYAGEMTAAVTLNAIYQGTTDADLAGLLANTQPALSVAINAQGDATHPLTIQASKMAYDQVTPDGGNNGWMTLAATGKALMNATDAVDSKMSPVQASFVTATNTPF